MVTRPSKTTSTSAKVAREYEKEEEFEATLSKEQLQVLEQENNSLLEGFEQMLDKIKFSSPVCEDTNGVGALRRHCSRYRSCRMSCYRTLLRKPL